MYINYIRQQPPRGKKKKNKRNILLHDVFSVHLVVFELHLAIALLQMH